MLVIAKIALARDNIQEKDGGVASAGNVIRRGAVGVVFSDKVIRTGIAVSIFSADIIRWEAGGVAFFDAVISRQVVEGGVAEGLGCVVIWEDVFACALLLCFPCHDDSNHGRVAFDASVDVVALQVEVVDEALCGVDDGASAR